MTELLCGRYGIPVMFCKMVQPTGTFLEPFLTYQNFLASINNFYFINVLICPKKLSMPGIFSYCLLYNFFYFKLPSSGIDLMATSLITIFISDAYLSGFLKMMGRGVQWGSKHPCNLLSTVKAYLYFFYKTFTAYLLFFHHREARVLARND